MWESGCAVVKGLSLLLVCDDVQIGSYVCNIHAHGFLDHSMRCEGSLAHCKVDHMSAIATSLPQRKERITKQRDLRFHLQLCSFISTSTWNALTNHHYLYQEKQGMG